MKAGDIPAFIVPTELRAQGFGVVSMGHKQPMLILLLVIILILAVGGGIFVSKLLFLLLLLLLVLALMRGRF